MSENEVMKRLQAIFRDVFGDNELRIDRRTNSNDIDSWDSLTHIKILEAVQDEFTLNFSLDEMIELNDVGKIVDAIIRGGMTDKRN